MKTGKKLWSLLLALVMVVSLLGGAFVVNAADSVTVTPDATYGGAVLNMTATKVDDQITVFDLASIGFGTGIEYAFWFEADGTFCFDQDVTLNYQGTVKAELKAGESKSIHFTLPKKDMGFYDNEKVYRLEDGLFRIYAGGNSRDCLMEEIRVAF